MIQGKIQWTVRKATDRKNEIWKLKNYINSSKNEIEISKNIYWNINWPKNERNEIRKYEKLFARKRMGRKTIWTKLKNDLGRSIAIVNRKSL